MVVKQGELRSNLKKYFDIAVDEGPVLIPRKDNRNVVIISESGYREMAQASRMIAYYSSLSEIPVMKAYDFDDLSGNSSDTPHVRNYMETTDIRTDNLDRLAVIGNFKDNWNGNGAAAFDKKLIKKIIGIVSELDIQPEIFPSAAGTIELEYSNSRKDFMGIEIGSEDEAEIFIVMYNGKESFETVNTEASAINERVKRFYE